MAPNKYPECGNEASNKAQRGCLVSVIIVFALFCGCLALGISQILKNPGRYTKRSILAKTLELDPSQEADMLKIFEACEIGEIISASVFQSGDGHTSYYLEDKETDAYKGAEYAIVVWINDTSKAVEAIHFHSQDIYLNGKVVSPITDYYVNSADRDQYRAASQLAVKQLLNYPDTAKFSSISGWTFEMEDEVVIVQSNVIAKNALNEESTCEFQVTFYSGNIISIIIDGTEYFR